MEVGEDTMVSTESSETGTYSLFIEIHKNGKTQIPAGGHYSPVSVNPPNFIAAVRRKNQPMKRIKIQGKFQLAQNPIAYIGRLSFLPFQAHHIMSIFTWQCKVEGSYEFNKMLENYKGEKRSEEQETTLNTEVPVVIPAGHTTEAK